MKKLTIILSVAILAVVLVVTSCSKQTEVKTVLNDSIARTEIFKTIAGNHEMMSEFMKVMKTNKHAMMMIQGDTSMMSNQNMMGNNQMMGNQNMMTDSTMQMFIDNMMKNGKMMNMMMQKMKDNNMMSEECMQNVENMMKSKAKNMDSNNMNSNNMNNMKH